MRRKKKKQKSGRTHACVSAPYFIERRSLVSFDFDQITLEQTLALYSIERDDHRRQRDLLEKRARRDAMFTCSSCLFSVDSYIVGASQIYLDNEHKRKQSSEIEMRVPRVAPFDNDGDDDE